MTRIHAGLNDEALKRIEGDASGSNSDLSAGLVGKQVINALQLTYRKHCLADDSIGWIELEDILRDALCEAMGDREFCRWLNDVAD